MTRTQALVIGILVGGVALVFVSLAALLFFDPIASFLPASPTATPPPPTVTPTPTLPMFMPTASQVTPQLEPTATNTRVPTVTPRPALDPTPTVVFSLPTLAIRPTDTPVVIPPTRVLPSPTPTPSLTPIVSRQYSISFRAEDEEIVEGKCTDLKWETEGVEDVRLNGNSVDASGEKEVCPKEDTTYELTIKLLDSAQVERHNVTIRVKAKEDED